MIAPLLLLLAPPQDADAITDVIEMLASGNMHVESVRDRVTCTIIETTGDKQLDLALCGMGRKCGRYVLSRAAFNKCLDRETPLVAAKFARDHAGKEQDHHAQH